MISRIWVRLLVGGAAMVATVVVGLTGTSFDPTPAAGGVPVGANQLMVVLALALIVGFLFYEAVEWLQTHRLDSIARQFTSRTIVLMPFAIALNIVLGQTVGSALKLPIYLDSIGTILVGVLAGPLAGAATGLLSNLAWTFVLVSTPFGSPYAWPFAITATEIGLLAGVFGYVGAFRPRPRTPPETLLAGVAAGAVLLGALLWYGILPAYRDLGCGPGNAAASPTAGCTDVAFLHASDPLFIVLAFALLAIVILAVVVLLVRLARDRDLAVVYVLVAGAVCGVISAFISTPIAALVFGGVTGSGTDFLVAAFQQAGSTLEDAVRQQSLISDPIDKAITYLIVFTLLASTSRRLTARFPQGERALGTVEG
ncbi:MAG: energy-coupling factor transport system substrate-specific component [Chloroflexota bacterium]|nr:energy-coupling factor transport system substrate-specific component [Chloroflexota bacterium]